MADEFDKRLVALASEEISRDVWGGFYLSWADEEHWLGGAYVLAYGPITARLRCQTMGINPGGQCLIIKLPDTTPMPLEKYRNRLLTREEILTIDPDSHSITEFEKGTP